MMDVTDIVSAVIMLIVDEVASIPSLSPNAKKNIMEY